MEIIKYECEIVKYSAKKNSALKNLGFRRFQVTRLAFVGYICSRTLTYQSK